MKLFNRLFFIAFLSMSIMQAMEQQPQEEEDYYAILGVPDTATENDIKSAYKRLARLFHPDKYADKEVELDALGYPDAASAENQWKKIQKAYETLSDSDKRADYNQAERGYGKIQKSLPGRAKESMKEALQGDTIDYKKLWDAETTASDYLYNVRNDPHDKFYGQMKGIALVAKGIKDLKDGENISDELQQKLDEIKQNNQDLIDTLRTSNNIDRLREAMSTFGDKFGNYGYVDQEMRDIGWNGIVRLARIAKGEGDGIMAREALKALIDLNNNFKKIPNYVSRQNELRALEQELGLHAITDTKKLTNDLRVLEKKFQDLQILVAA